MPDPIPLDYNAAPARRDRKRSFLQIAIILGCAGTLLATLCAIPLRRTRMHANQVASASNLKWIGQGIFLYANANKGAYPPDFQSVLITQQIAAEAFTSPNSDDTRATGASPAAIAQNLAKPGHCSYVYVGQHLTSQSNPECIVAIENPACNDLEGANVLFADGHVEFFLLPEIVQALTDLAAGKNPPTTPSTFTPQTARQTFNTLWAKRMPQLQTGVWNIPATQPANTRP